MVLDGKIIVNDDSLPKLTVNDDSLPKLYTDWSLNVPAEKINGTETLHTDVAITSTVTVHVFGPVYSQQNV
jgi:hypothetical protein